MYHLDRVKFTTPTTGTGGTIAVGSASAGFRTPAGAGAADGQHYRYKVEDASDAWEIGYAEYDAAGTALIGRTVGSSSNSDNAIDLSGSAVVAFIASKDDLLTWFNVKGFGATGDGATDDTTAITAAITALNAAGDGVLYFPEGTYLTSGGFTITANALISGAGMGDYEGDDGATEVLCNSATASLFTVNADRATFRDLALRNTAASTPSSGAGITVTSSNQTQKVDYENISVSGFYINVDVQVGANWHMYGAFVIGPVLYGVKIRNTVNGDAGDWAISDSHVYSKTYNSTAGIRVESSGGGKIVNCKINANLDLKRFDYGVDVSGSGSTSILLVSNCSIENIDTNCIRTSGDWDYIIVNGVQCALYTATGTNAISMNGADYFIISNCTLVGNSPSTTAAAIDLTSCTYGYISNINSRYFTSVVSQASCSNITDRSNGGQAQDDLLDDIAALSDPNADRILFWDDSAGAFSWLTAGNNLTITDTTIKVSSHYELLQDEDGDIITDESGEYLYTSVND